MTGHEHGSAMALEAVGLGRHYRRRTALDDCSFQLPAGRVCALVGPNGAGKSTLLTMAAGLLAPTRGRVEVFGTPAGEPRTMPSVALLAQDKPLFPQLSVDEHLRLGRELNPRWCRQPAAQMVEGLPRTARVETLSPGSARSSPWRWPWASSPTCCCWTNPWRSSIPWPGTRRPPPSWPTPPSAAPPS